MANSKEKALKDVGYKGKKKLKRKGVLEISPLYLEEKKKVMINYIFDEKKILKNKVFTQSKLNSNLFCFGILLPKMINLLDKQNNVIGKEQTWKPVLITSDKNILEATKETELKYKIKFESIPSDLPLKWSLNVIEDYLNGDEKVPDLEPIDVLNKVKEQYERFCFFREKAWYKVNALWDVGTYFYNLFNNFPIKEERGLMETGKSKCMRVSKNMAFNTTKIMINPSEATLFRETHDKRPTKYIDEAEKLFIKIQGKMESDNRVELINGSYEKGSAVPRIEKIGNKFVCVYYSVYSPTRIGSINGLFGSTESRSITQIHTRSLDTDKRGETDTEETDPEFKLVRDYLYLFALKYWKDVENNYRDSSLFENLDLKKRDLQIWKPLLSIAKLVGDDWFKEVSTFSEKLSLQKKEDMLTEDSWDYRFLKIVKGFLDTGTTKIRPKDIRKKYSELYSSESERTPAEKTITTHLDKIGFKELKERDMLGVFYNLNLDTFVVIVSPICPDLTKK